MAARRGSNRPTPTGLPETMQVIANKREGDNLTVGLHEVPTPTVDHPNDIIIKMEACPLNPSDLTRVANVGRFGGGKPENVTPARSSVVQTALPESAQSQFQDGEALILGGEGCGIVVATGDSDEAEALIGKRVAVAAGVNYAQYVKHRLGTNPNFAVLPGDIGPLEGASVFVNPLTVVGFVHTMQHNGHKAIVHTAAGSQVGKMLIKYCKQLDVPLVNIVRKAEVAEGLKEMGAEYVVNSSAETYKEDLYAAIKATGATIGFDATGGGSLAHDMLSAFEKYLREKDGAGSGAAAFYGPSGFRQVYRYGGLDSRETEMPMSLGVGNWEYGGWLMPFHFQKFGPEHLQKAVEMAVAGLKDTFSSAYGKHLTLEEFASSPEQYLATLQSQTEKKFLVTPNGAL